MKTFKEYYEEELNEGIWSWVKTFAREWKYDQGYTGQLSFLTRLEEEQSPIPNDIWEMITYDTKKDLVELKHLRTGKVTQYTLKSFQDENKSNGVGWLDIGEVKNKPMNAWEHIQMFETIQKKDVEITSIRGAAIMLAGKKYHSEETSTQKSEKFIIKKSSNLKGVFGKNNNWLNVIDDEGNKVQILIYDIAKYN